MEDLVVLRDIQGLGFDTLSWFNAAQDRSQWSNVCKSTAVEECWIGTGIAGHTVYCGFRLFCL